MCYYCRLRRSCGSYAATRAAVDYTAAHRKVYSLNDLGVDLRTDDLSDVCVCNNIHTGFVLGWICTAYRSCTTFISQRQPEYTIYSSR